MHIFKKGDNIKLGKFFNSKEFECNCKVCDNQPQYISEGLIAKLDKVRELFGKPLVVTSGYRCLAHNTAIKGAPSSTHVTGLGADITPSKATLDALDDLHDICYKVFDNIGNGINKGFIHVDDRPAKSTGKRTWLY